ncbi:MAG: phosphatidylglycerol lysyltransferase domain-containing protein [Elusimicrobia bacterium]|nr:phosphatidylglycerol lysyltransferase domain-containing protein [Elusimicrobiota bacterium]
MNIPAYPKYRNIEISDKKLFDDLFSKIKPEICEYTFANLFAWKDLYNLSLSTLEDFVLLSSRKNETSNFFDPIGLGDKKSVIKKILKDGKTSFILVQEDTKKLFENESDISIFLDRDNCDYLYNSEDLIVLKGKIYDGKRNYIKRFKSGNKYKYVRINDKNNNECLKFVDKWCEFRDCEGAESLKHEKKAIKEMLGNFSCLKLFGGLIEIGGEIAALAAGELLNKDTFVIHILKSKNGVIGLNQTMNNEFLANEAAGFKFVNMEQDLGVEGLRKSKLSYHPLKLINKYTIRLK